MGVGVSFFYQLIKLSAQKQPRGNLTSWPSVVLFGLFFNLMGLGLSCFSFSQFFVFTGFLTAVQVALLTIYDMCKAVDRGMVMGDVKLLEKSGGKSGEWKAQ